MYASEGVMATANAPDWSRTSAMADGRFHERPSSGNVTAESVRPANTIRRAPHRSDSRPKNGWNTVLPSAAAANTRPTRPGRNCRSDCRCMEKIGSTIDSVVAIEMTSAVHRATAGIAITVRIGTGSRAVRSAGESYQRNAAAPSAPMNATNRNGSRIPPVSYNHPPIEGPIMNATLVPDMTTPLIRPRSSTPYRSAINAKPTTQVTASAAPCIRRAAKSHGRVSAYAKRTVETASAIKPPTIGPLRPIRSDTAPIGIDVNSSVNPNAANRNPIVVGDAPRRRPRSGRTGKPTEYVMMSVKVANV